VVVLGRLIEEAIKKAAMTKYNELEWTTNQQFST